MSISNFVPEIWSPAILQNLRNVLVYANMLNRDYEGEIQNVGSTVHITSFGFPATRSYVKNQDISWDLLSDATRALVVDQADYFAFTVDDVDRRQALPGFVQQATSDAGYKLANDVDTYVAAQLAAGATSAGSDVALGSTTPDDAYDKLIVPMRTALKRADIPEAGRWIVVPPEVYALLLRDSRFIKANESGNPLALRTGIIGGAGGDVDDDDAGSGGSDNFGPGTAGWVGSIAGFDVFESVNVPLETPTDTGHYTILAGHSMAGTFADQILETEAIRLQAQFGDGIRGLHTYGMKVVRPTAVQKLNVSIS